MPSFPGGRHSGIAVPLGRANVDTDAIFPKQYGRSTARSGYGPVLFDSWRYHAVRALRDYGFKAVIAPSFGDIFPQNCPLNGVAAIVVPAADVDRLFALAERETLHLALDLEAGQLRCGPEAFRFPLSPRERVLLTQDVDWIGATLAHGPRIAAFETARLARQPWLDRKLER